MSDLNFRKQLLLNEFKTMSYGKSNEEIIPLLLAINNKAKQAGITFTREDCELVLKSMSDNMTKQELEFLPKLLSLINRT